MYREATSPDKKPTPREAKSIVIVDNIKTRSYSHSILLCMLVRTSVGHYSTLC